MVRFDDVLELTADGGVDAKGPLDADETMKELCAWVFQEQDENQAAATEMTTTDGPIDTSIRGKWRFRLGKVGDYDLREGPAFAVAVALIRDAHDKQTVVWWGHPITLKAPPGASEAASST